MKTIFVLTLLFFQATASSTAFFSRHPAPPAEVDANIDPVAYGLKQCIDDCVTRKKPRAIELFKMSPAELDTMLKNFCKLECMK